MERKAALEGALAPEKSGDHLLINQRIQMRYQDIRKDQAGRDPQECMVTKRRVPRSMRIARPCSTALHPEYLKTGEGKFGQKCMKGNQALKCRLERGVEKVIE